MQRLSDGTLWELMEKELMNIKARHKYASIADALDNEKECCIIIDDVLQSNIYTHPEKVERIPGVTQNRARHILITYLMGQAFKKFLHFDNKLDHLGSLLSSDWEKKNLWTLTALYHDYGYYLEDLKNPFYQYSAVKPNVLNDISTLEESKKNKIMAYTLDEIYEYDSTKRKMQQDKNTDEKIDHGIFGGIRAYAVLRKKDPYPIDCTIGIAMTIVQHNIFKSSSKDDDEKYYYKLSRLQHDTDFRITQETPLLLFLSLIDTVECTKKFGRQENADKFLMTKTILSGITVHITEKTIEIDFSDLHKKILQKKSEELESRYRAYVKSIEGLVTWTDFLSVKLVEDRYTIMCKVSSERKKVIAS